MKNIFSNDSGMKLSRLWLVAAMLVIATGAKADEQLSDKWVEIVIGENTFAGGYSWHYFYYDATTDGTLVLSGAANPGLAYTDSTTTTTVDETSVSYVNGVKTSSTTVTAGTRYYFKTSGISSSDYTFTAELQTADTEISLVSVSPEEYSSINIASNELIVLTFNMEVDFDEAFLSVKGITDSITGNQSSKMLITFDTRDVIYEWLTDGSAVAGDTLSLLVKGITAAQGSSRTYGTDGSLTVYYTVPEMPTTLDEETLPETFLSYWAEDDEDGKVVLTFSKDLYCGDDSTYISGARLSFGNMTDEDYYLEDVPTTVSGNKVIVDFTGKLRTLEAMGSTTLYVLDAFGNETDELRTMNLKIYNVCDADGNAAYSETQGNIGSYSYSFDYEQLTANVTWEFTPEAGTSIVETDYIEIAITGYEVITYSGVQFDYTYQGEAKTATVDKEDVVVETDALVADFTYLMVPVSDEIQASVDITVTLVDVSYSDGVTRDPISAQYDQVSLTLVTPAETTVDILEQGAGVVVTTGIDSRIGTMLLSVSNVTDGSAVLTDAALSYDSDAAQWATNLDANVTLYADNEYLLTFALYDTDGTILTTATATLIGSGDESSGIAIVAADGQSTGSVYTVTGVRVATAKDMSDVNNLPAGIYIVDKKKVVVK